MFLIVGCGFLGQYILQDLQERAAGPVIATYRNNKNACRFDGEGIQWLPLDVTKEVDLAALKQACGDEAVTVFYLASCHQIDYVYQNPRLAYQINVSALDRFLQTFPQITDLFYASTDCVYGEGADRPGRFRETDETKPINIYGQQKKEAEQRVLRAGFHVARLPYMLGPSLSESKNFYDHMTESFRQSRSVDMVDGLERSVLSYRQVADLLVCLSFKRDIPSILNIAGDQSYTKYQMGCRIAEQSGCSGQLVKKMSNEDAKKLFLDNRARSTVMDNRLLKEVLQIQRLEWMCP